MNKLDFTYEEVHNAVESSTSIRTFLQHLGMKVNNGNYRKAHQICSDHGLDVPKHDYRSNGEALKHVNKIPDEEFFCSGVLRGGTHLKKRLMADHSYEDICSECGQLPVWNGKPLTLQVDHIDGDRFNNVVENLRILCGHCHIQTETYGNKRGRGVGPVYSYCTCGKRMSSEAFKCTTCENKSRTGTTLIEFPPIEDIVRKVQELGGWSAASRYFSIGDNTLRKHLKRNDVDPASIEYKRRQPKG